MYFGIIGQKVDLFDKKYKNIMTDTNNNTDQYIRLKWNRNDPFHFDGLVKVKIPGDGHCFFHSVCRAFSDDYINERYRTKDGTYVRISRKDFVIGLRKELAYTLGNKVDPNDDKSPTHYDTISRGNLADFVKTGTGQQIEKYSLKNMQKELSSGSAVDGIYIEFISNIFKHDIYLLDLNERDVYIIGNDLDILYKNRNSIVLVYTGNHYDVAGIETSNGKIITHFSHNNPFIKAIMKRIKEKINYGQLDPHSKLDPLPEAMKNKLKRDESKYSNSRQDNNHTVDIAKSENHEVSKYDPGHSNTKARESNMVPMNNPRYTSNDPRYTSNDPRYTSNDPRYISNDPRYASNDPRYTSNDPHYKSNDPRYGSNDPRYASNDPRYKSDDPRYGSNDPRYASNDPRYASNDPRYGSNDPRYTPNDPHYKSNDPRYVSNDTRHTSNDSRHTSNDSRHTPNDPRYTSNDSHYKSNDPRYTSNDSRHISNDPRYISNNDPPGPGNNKVAIDPRHRYNDTRTNDSNYQRHKDPRNYVGNTLIVKSGDLKNKDPKGPGNTKVEMDQRYFNEDNKNNYPSYDRKYRDVENPHKNMDGKANSPEKHDNIKGKVYPNSPESKSDNIIDKTSETMYDRKVNSDTSTINRNINSGYNERNRSDYDRREYEQYGYDRRLNDYGDRNYHRKNDYDTRNIRNKNNGEDFNEKYSHDSDKRGSNRYHERNSNNMVDNRMNVVRSGSSNNYRHNEFDEYKSGQYFDYDKATKYN